MMTVRKMFALFTAVFMTACLFAMFGAPDVQAAATAPNMDRRPRHSTFIDKNRKTATVAVAAISNMAAVTPAAIFVCPYDATILEVSFIQSGANGTHAPTATTGLLNYNVNRYSDGGAGLVGTAATILVGVGQDAGTTQFNPTANTYGRFEITSANRSCKAGDTLRFGQTSHTAGDGTADFPAGVLEIVYTIQDVVAYTRDGGLI